LPFETFAIKKLRRRFVDMPSLRYVRGAVDGMINRSLFFLATGEYESAERFRNMALMIQRDHNKAEVEETAKDDEANPQRQMLPPFLELMEMGKGRAFMTFSPELQKRLQGALELTDEQVEEYRNNIREIIKERTEQSQQTQEQKRPARR
jgi:hypothetical protein